MHCGQGEEPRRHFVSVTLGGGAVGRGGEAAAEPAAVFGEGGFGQEDTMISAAQLLDELMGRDRNLAPDEKRSNVRWDHESVSEAEPPLRSPPSLPLSFPSPSQGRGFVVATRAAGAGLQLLPARGQQRGEGMRCRPWRGFPGFVGGAGRALRAEPEAAGLLHGGRGAG